MKGTADEKPKEARQVIWVDDDINKSLVGLRGLFKRRGLSILGFNNAKQAIRHLKREFDRDPNPSISMLVDVILPQDDSGEALNPYIGLKLAENAASLGVDRISFLTVMDQNEVMNQYSMLEKKYPRTRFQFNRKVHLLGGNTLNDLVKFLITEG
jgi:hypothetical protein